MKKTLALVLVLAAMLMCSVAFAGTLNPDAVDGPRNASVAPVVSTNMTDGAIVNNHMTPADDPDVFTIQYNGAAYDWDIFTFAEGVRTHVNGMKSLNSSCPILAHDVMNNKYGVNSGSDLTPNNGELTHWLVITYTDPITGNQVQEEYQFFVDWSDYQNTWTGVHLHSFSNYTLPCWYPNNTANVFGPKVPGSWQTYAAVDLSVQGTQELKLIGAGAWTLGTVTVTVDGDTVVVDYLMDEDINTRDTWDDINVDSEYLNIFADAASIDIYAESAFAFGTPFSITEDLGGDTTVALYVCNKVDYPSHSPYVTRFWPNMCENKAIVEAMNAILAE